jgi:hypothetical protein
VRVIFKKYDTLQMSSTKAKGSALLEQLQRAKFSPSINDKIVQFLSPLEQALSKPQSKQ